MCGDKPTTGEEAIANDDSGRSPSSGCQSEELARVLKEYGGVFADLANSRSPSIAGLLDYYAAPFRMMTAERAILLLSEEDLLGPLGLGGELHRFRDGGYSTTTLHRCEVRHASSYLALVDAVWIRSGANVADLEVALTYGLCCTARGWRIDAIAPVD
ncbi:DUF6841 family protein [Sphingomonas sp. UYP23]